MAAGRLFGHPWIGILLATGMVCGLLCWMLQGWVPAQWALFGAVLFSMRVGIYHYWMNSYWGGSLCAIGGVLLLGVVPRILRRPRASHGFIIGLALAILANTRPWEGALFAIPVCTWLFIRLGARKRDQFLFFCLLAGDDAVDVGVPMPMRFRCHPPHVENRDGGDRDYAQNGAEISDNRSN